MAVKVWKLMSKAMHQQQQEGTIAGAAVVTGAATPTITANMPVVTVRPMISSITTTMPSPSVVPKTYLTSSLVDLTRLVMTSSEEHQAFLVPASMMSLASVAGGGEGGGVVVVVVGVGPGFSVWMMMMMITMTSLGAMVAV